MASIATKLAPMTTGGVVGVVMVFFSVAILLWNAEWSKEQFATLSEAKQAFFSQPPQSGTVRDVDALPVGSLAWLRGRVRGGDIMDSDTGVTLTNVAKVERNVEMFQWEPIKDQDIRSAQENNTPVVPRKGWSSNVHGELIPPASGLQATITVQNPSRMEIKDSNFFPAGHNSDLFVENYRLDGYLASQISDTRPLTLKSDDSNQIFYPSSRFPGYFVQSDGHYLYLRRITTDRIANGNQPRYDAYGNFIPPITQAQLDRGLELPSDTPLSLRSASPAIGDQRIAYKFIPTYEVSLLGVKTGDTEISVYRSSKRNVVLPILYVRSHATPQELFAMYQSNASHSVVAWTFVAWIVCIIGITLAAAPLFGILSLVPIVGNVFAAMGAITAFQGALYLSTIVIAIGAIPSAIILYGQQHGMMLAAFGVAVFGLSAFLNKAGADGKDH